LDSEFGEDLDSPRCDAL